MLAHTRKHHTERQYPFSERPKDKNTKDSITWKIADKEAFGNLPRTALNLRGLRNREGLTQKQFGQALGTEQSNVSKMERGVRQIGVKIAKRLEQKFDIDYRLFL